MKFRNFNKIGVSRILAFLIIAIFSFLPFLSFAVSDPQGTCTISQGGTVNGTQQMTEGKCKDQNGTNGYETSWLPNSGASSQTSGSTSSGKTSNSGAFKNPTPPQSASNSSTEIVNPIGTKTINDFVKKALESVIKIGIPVIALAIIYCGFLFVAAQGNSEKITEAKSALLYTLIGAVILLGAWSIAQIISETVLAL